MLRDDNIIYDSELDKEIVCSYKNEFELEINLNECFPLFSFMKDKKDNTLKMLISLFDNIELQKSINHIMNLYVFSYEHKCSPENSEKPTLSFRFISVDKELFSFKHCILENTMSLQQSTLTNNDNDNSLLKINLLDIKPFNSIYNFNIENNKLSCTVEHTKGNMLTEVIYNIMFTSLMVIFMSNIMNLESYMVKYKCNYSYYLESDNHIIEKIAWNVPDVLPLLKLNEKNYKKIDDYCIDDLIFLGLNI
jgi:hypothetical protein